MIRRTLWCLAAAVLCACTYVPFDTPRQASYALPHDGNSASRAAAELTGHNPSRVAGVPLIEGNDALGARLKLIETAETSIDIKTFLIKPDLAGALIWVALFEAAERGVKIRLLFDDVFTTARDDEVATLDAHPNVEIRVFNPLSRNSTTVVNFMLDFGRVNRRMHNKAMIVDGAMAIVGGRNIADEYYQIGSGHEFADFDLFFVGGPVRDLSSAFDLYWNDQWSLPLSALKEGDIATLREAEAAFRAQTVPEATEIYTRAINSRFLQDLSAGRVTVFHGTGEISVDAPEKLRTPPGKGPYVLGEKLFQTLGKARKEVLILTPYFVPEDYGATFFETLAQRGVRVRIVTNSLAATNHAYVHGGYAPYRKRLLAAGVELLEVRSDAYLLTHDSDTPYTMHTKLAIVDKKMVFIGSPNMDPRSIRQNSEIGLFFDSPAFARALQDGIDKSLPDYAFVVTASPEDGSLVWTYTGSRKSEVFHKEPGAGFWSLFVAKVTSWLPVERQL